VSPDLVRKLVAEFLGTFLLVLLGVGTAVAGLKGDGSVAGTVGVALAFGLTLLALAYALGPVSGCHINPAVTLGVLLNRGMTATEAALYWIVQLAGGIAGAAVLALLTSGGFGKVTDTTGALGANDYGTTISLGGAFVLEALLTFVLVSVVLLVTGRSASPGFAGLAIGLTLAAVHLFGIPLTGTGVNPARSLGPALFTGGVPLRHVWLFLVAPLVGGAVAAGVIRLVTAPGVTEEALREAAPVLATDETGAQLPPDAAPGRGAVPRARGASDGTGARVPEERPHAG
jgi:aquaporin Z